MVDRAEGGSRLSGNDELEARERLDLLMVMAVYNSQDVLPEVLEAYCAQPRFDGAWAIAIIDNASTDRTPQILDEFAGRLPILRYYAAQPGRSAALNTALDAVRPFADLYVFTDDDAVPQPGFLAAWDRARRERPASVLFGGAVRPKFRSPPPAWLLRFRQRFAELYTLLDPAEVNAAKAFEPFGPNMAVRGSVISAGLRYFEGIGPDHTRRLYPMGSESDFNRRVVQATGARPEFVADAVVDHLVRPWQMTRAYVRDRAFRHGSGSALRRLRGDTASGPRGPRIDTASQALRRVLALVGLPRFVWSYHWARGYADALRSAADD